jgi:hypothetical protein
MLIIIVALVLGTAVDRFMERLGIRPADPDERAGGIRDVIARLQTWVERRRSERS